VYKDGQWLLDRNGDFQWDPASEPMIGWGSAGFKPVIGDWNGTRTSKIGVEKDGYWVLDKNGDYQWDPVSEAPIGWGVPGDVPVVGDWNSSGSAKIGVFLPPGYSPTGAGAGTWILDQFGTYAYNPNTATTVVFPSTAPQAYKQVDLVYTPVVGTWPPVLP
jgi:hypothetical protein